MKSSRLSMVCLLALVFLGGCVSTLPNTSKKAITSIDFSPDGKLLALANDQEIRVLDAGSNRLINTLRLLPADTKGADPQHYRHGVGDSMVFLDETRIATTGMGGLVSIWDVTNGSRLAVIDPLPGEEFASTIDYSIATRRLVIGTSAGQVLLTGLTGNAAEPLVGVANLEGYVWDLQFGRDGRYFASAALVTRGPQSATASGSASSLIKIDETASDGTYDQVSVQPEPSNVFIWDAESREKVGDLQGAVRVFRMSLVPGEPTLLTAGEEVQTWEFLTRQQAEQISDPSMVLQAIGVGTLAVVSVAALAVGVFTPLSFGEQMLFTGFPIIPTGPFIRHACSRAITIAPDAQTIVSTTWGPSHNVMAVIDRSENKVIEKWTADVSVCDMQFSPDGKHLVTATSNGAFIYDTTNWKKTNLKKLVVSDGK
jgi:WD40 repeat protein